MRAMLLCAGLGTRLGALSDERPKPLLPVCDVPILRYGLALLEAAGVREVAINLHHRGDLIEDEIREGGAGGLAIVWSRENVLLGTGGGIHEIHDWLTDGGRESFFVLNGKLVIDADLRALAALHKESGAEGTMLLREVPDADRWGRIDLDEESRVRTILGERAPDFVQSSNSVLHGNMFTGVHVVSPALAQRLPDGNSCIVRQGYIPALKAGARIAGLRHTGYFQEHSTPARYLAGNFALLRGEVRLPHAPAPLTGVSPEAQVGVGVELVEPYRIGRGALVGDGARIGPDVVVGRGARVMPGARLERAVVWPDAVASGNLRDAIVTPKGVHTVDDAPSG
jgi:NDP-sugar pyrophosphorylase family protein